MIECDWNAIETFQGLDWGDARIASDPIVLARWRYSLKDRATTWRHGAAVIR